MLSGIGPSVPVWGTASDGERVTVEFQGQKVGATAHGGYWIVHLNPLKAGGPYAMKINGLEIRNILVGEVWVCGGQSNMAFQLQRCENGEAAAASSAVRRASWSGVSGTSGATPSVRKAPSVMRPN